MRQPAVPTNIHNLKSEKNIMHYMANKPALRTNNKYNHIISITVKEATLWSNCTEEMNTCLSLHKFTQLYKIKNYTVLFYSFNSPSVKKVTLLYQGLLRGLFTRPCEDVKCSEPRHSFLVFLNRSCQLR